MAEINRAFRIHYQSQRFFGVPSPTSDQKLRVVRSEEDLEAFAIAVYKQLYDISDGERNKTRKKRLISKLWKSGGLSHLQFTVQVRHDAAHGPELKAEAEATREKLISAGYRRLFGSSRPAKAHEWTAFHIALCEGILADLNHLKTRIADEGLGPLPS